ncbi:MAG: hypothetical protein GY757_44190, partial [bacterium]|nr:hypothetical protein [bacterium]
MKVNVSVCTGCGGPLPVVEHQFVTNCLYCDSRYYVRQDMPPAVVINPGIEKETARDLVLNELHSKEIDADFIKRSASEGVTLYYIPFFEVRGLKAGLQQSTDPGKQVEFSYQAYERIEKGNDLNDMALDFFDDAIVQEAIVNADTTTFNPVELRKKGVVLSPQGVELFKK